MRQNAQNVNATQGMFEDPSSDHGGSDGMEDQPDVDAEGHLAGELVGDDG